MKITVSLTDDAGAVVEQVEQPFDAAVYARLQAYWQETAHANDPDLQPATVEVYFALWGTRMFQWLGKDLQRFEDAKLSEARAARAF